LLLPSPSKRAK